MIVDTRKHHLTYYDSLGDYRGECARALYYTREWISSELLHQTHLGRISAARAFSFGNIGDWTYTHNPGPSPSQTNGFDCGVFYLATILYHIQGRAPNYHQIHLLQIRQQLTFALLTHTMPSPFIPLSPFDYPLSYVHTTSRHVTLLRHILPPRLLLSPYTTANTLNSSLLITLPNSDDEDPSVLHLLPPILQAAPLLTFASTTPLLPRPIPHSHTHPP